MLDQIMNIWEVYAHNRRTTREVIQTEIYKNIEKKSSSKTNQEPKKKLKEDLPIPREDIKRIIRRLNHHTITEVIKIKVRKDKS